MYSRRVVYAFGLCVCLLYMQTDTLLGQSSVQDPFLSVESQSNYPMYFVFGSFSTPNSAGGSLRSVGLTTFGAVYASPLDVNAPVANNSAFASKLRSAIVDDLIWNNQISGAVPLSDYDSGSADSLLLECKDKIDVVRCTVNTQYLSYFCCLELKGSVVIRTVNPDSTKNINNNPPDTLLYDVYYNFWCEPKSVSTDSNGDEWINAYLVTKNLSTGALNYSTSYVCRVNYTNTWYCQSSFRMDSDGNIIRSVEASKLGLPFVPTDLMSLNFCSNTNPYWSFGSADSYGQWSFTFPTFGSLYRPLKSTFHVITNSTRYDFNGVPGDPIFSTNVLSALDSDSGGMSDFHEWYQTKHNLLDPSDDAYVTPEIQVPPEDLPEPEDGESVVDIGKDTVGRYENYWDNQVGDPFDLDNIEQPETSEPENFELEHWDVESIYNTTKGSTDTSKLENAVDTVFESVDDVQDISLSFTPTVDMSSLGVTWQGQTIDLNPVHVLGLNTRAVSDVANKFRMIRLALLLVEWITFFYACYKLVLNSISGSSGGGSEE